MRILVTRPAADADRFKDVLEAAGHDVLVDPMMTIEPVEAAGLASTDAVAVVATSRNALRALDGRPALTALARLPLFAVGPGTATTARDLGFTDVREGAATGADLVAPVSGFAARSPGRPVLHLRGERTAFDIAAALRARGVAVGEAVVYRQVPAERLAQATVLGLSGGTIDLIVLMSPLTAATWLKLVAEAELNNAAMRVAYACLSRGIAQALAPLGARTHVAAKPSGEEMLALITRLAAQSGGIWPAGSREGT